jgi:hypothetical protein
MIIKRNTKKHNEYSISGKLTLGKLEAMRRALELYKEQSPVANDLYYELTNAMDGSMDTSQFSYIMPEPFSS